MCILLVLSVVFGIWSDLALMRCSQFILINWQEQVRVRWMFLFHVAQILHAVPLATSLQTHMPMFCSQ